MFTLEIRLKRVQTFIFEVPRLKAMLGANALIGHAMRHKLPALMANKGRKLNWPQSLPKPAATDPLDSTTDPDDPAALYAKGIMARDGGHFIAAFDTHEEAQAFLDLAEATLAELLPGVLYDASIVPFPRPEREERPRIAPRENHLLDLPVLQVCQETGREPASERKKSDGRTYWQSQSVAHRLAWGDQFYKGDTKDIIGLMRQGLYPDQDKRWREPNDLAELAAGGYLALIHADGNGIGKRCDNAWKAQRPLSEDLSKEAHGEAFFHSMRVAVRRAVVDALAATFTDGGGPRSYEVLMLGGDDLLLVCRADKALDFAHRYAEELAKYSLADGPALDVAIGVAIAQKSYPVHRLQELAESLASSAKRLFRGLPDNARGSVIDWQVVTQSWFEGVAEARRQSERIVYSVNGRRETLLLTARPYRVLGPEGLGGLLDAAKALDGGDTEKAARSPLRSLRGACERGRLMGEIAFGRLPETLQSWLGWEGKAQLWKKLGAEDEPMHAARALDVIGIWEIARLGRKKHD